MTETLYNQQSPCPFCGDRGDWESAPCIDPKVTGERGAGWMVCRGCHARIPGDSRADAEQRWNLRHGIIQ